MESKNITVEIEQNYEKRTWSRMMPAYCCGDKRQVAPDGGAPLTEKYEWLKKKGFIKHE